MKGKKLFNQIIDSAYAELALGYERSKDLPSTVTGNEREVLIEFLLNKVLPPSIRYGSGVIIDYKGTSTGQVDLVLELPASVSLPISSHSQRLYFADTVAAAIEVKSDLQPLVAIVKKRLKLDASLYTLLQILSLTLFEKITLQQALTNANDTLDTCLFDNQLILDGI